MKKSTMAYEMPTVETLLSQLTISEQEVREAKAQLKMARRAQRAYGKLIVALTEQIKATNKVKKLLKKTIDLQIAATEGMAVAEQNDSTGEEIPKAPVNISTFDFELETLSDRDEEVCKEILADYDYFFPPKRRTGEDLKEPSNLKRDFVPFIHTRITPEEKECFLIKPTANKSISFIDKAGRLVSHSLQRVKSIFIKRRVK